MKATRITTCTASPIGDQVIPPLTIIARPRCAEHTSIKAAMAHHKREGERVADALWEHLPGGTVDQILRRLLERRASALIVRF